VPLTDRKTIKMKNKVNIAHMRKIKIVQHNLNGQRIASLQLRDYCQVNKVIIALVQEPVYIVDKVYTFEDCRIVSDDNGPRAVIIFMENDISTIAIKPRISKYVATAKIDTRQ